MVEYNVIISRSSITKAEKALASGKIKAVLFESREDDWRNCYLLADDTNAYLWPSSWGYYGVKDGHHFSSDPVSLLQMGAQIAKGSSPSDVLLNVIIDEEK